MEFLILLAIIFAVAFIVTGPLRRARAEAGVGPQLPGSRHDGGPSGDEPAPGSLKGDFERASALAELEAAREAKYREIRDTQLDFDTGKLSPEDFEALDAGLRSEALQILEQIDELRPPGQPARSEDGSRERE
ncbi:MAG: hypothetical protein ACR2JH_03250 [Solirubrobacteraceae bacterium]